MTEARIADLLKVFVRTVVRDVAKIKKEASVWLEGKAKNEFIYEFKMAVDRIRRRWLDFRNGHTLYLVFLMGFANFILIFHRLLIERVPVLQDLFSNLWMFAIVFVFIYVPTAILVGY